jgi:hypothetical protein
MEVYGTVWIWTDMLFLSVNVFPVLWPQNDELLIPKPVTGCPLWEFDRSNNQQRDSEV